MASIGGLSSSTSGSLGSIRGYGGLASGLDRDSLIEQMTSGTQSKIDKQKQEKTKLQWEMDAFRNISDKMIDFAEKYTSTLTSPTNLFSSSFWGKNHITVNGANGKYIDISGAATSDLSWSLLGVKQLAKNTQAITGKISSGILTTGKLDPSQNFDITNLEGKTLTISYGDTDYYVTLPTGEVKGEGNETFTYDYTTAEKAAASINKALESVAVNAGVDGVENLADIIKVEFQDGHFSMKNVDTNGNIVKLKSGSALEYMGFETEEGTWEPVELQQNGSVKAENAANLITKRSFGDVLAGNTLTFSYNGKTETITLSDDAGRYSGGNALVNLQTDLQNKLNAAFGTDRIKVGLSDGKLSFKTMRTEGGRLVEDETSVFSLDSGGDAMLGKNGAFNTVAGSSNRVNLQASLADSGFLAASGTIDPNASYGLKINGVQITFKGSDSLYEIMSKINESDAGVKISYESTTNRLTLVSLNEGAGGSIVFSEGDASDSEGKPLQSGLDVLFGSGGSKRYDVTQGQDAVITIQQSNGEILDLYRGSNSFTMDGVTVSLKGTFGYDSSGDLIEGTEAVTFDAQVDTDKIIDGIKDMIEQYNEIIELVNKEVSTRPDRDYAPLTDSQKKEMSEDEIKLWEEKAKEGILFNDTDLRSLSSDMRFVLDPALIAEFEKIGITISSNAADNGKLSVDESKLKAALTSDPSGVEALFTQKKAETGVDGLAVKLDSMLDKYVQTMGSMSSKGILIRRAGSTKAATSVTQNSIYKEMEEIDKIIENLKERLKSEQDRYVQQFTSLETLISQMNSQSSWLSQQFG